MEINGLVAGCVHMCVIICVVVGWVHFKCCLYCMMRFMFVFTKRHKYVSAVSGGFCCVEVCRRWIAKAWVLNKLCWNGVCLCLFTSSTLRLIRDLSQEFYTHTHTPRCVDWETYKCLLSKTEISLCPWLSFSGFPSLHKSLTQELGSFPEPLL